jgi:hypothetical protein
VHDELRRADRLRGRPLRMCVRELQGDSIDVTKVTLLTSALINRVFLKPLSAMNVTTVHGTIGLDHASHDHDCRNNPVSLPYRHRDSWDYDHERKRQHTAVVAYQPCPADRCSGIPPRFSCHGMVLRVVRIVEHFFVGGSIP